MSMYDDSEHDNDQELHDKILQDLISHLEDRMGDRFDSVLPKKGMSVEVAAPDKDSLKEGLKKAGDVADMATNLHEAQTDGLHDGGSPNNDDKSIDDMSEDEKLMALLDGGDYDEEKNDADEEDKKGRGGRTF